MFLATVALESLLNRALFFYRHAPFVIAASRRGSIEKAAFPSSLRHYATTFNCRRRSLSRFKNVESKIGDYVQNRISLKIRLKQKFARFREL